MFLNRRSLKSLVLTATCLLVGLMTGCKPGWVSKDSKEGQAMEKLAQENRMIPVAAPKDWPIRFSPVEIERRFAHEEGTQVRAVLPWKLVGSHDDAQPALAALAREIGVEVGAKKVNLLSVRVRYFDADGRQYGDELVNLVLVRGKDTTPLLQMVTHGSPARLTVTLESVTLYDPVTRDEK